MSNVDVSAINFRPPYQLNGSCSVIWSLLTSSHQDALGNLLIPPGVKPMTFGRLGMPAIVIFTHWNPHPEHPQAYHEVILSIFTWERGRIRSLPLRLWLNDPFHVELGRRHYGLPKILNDSLSVRENGLVLSARGEGIDLDLVCWRWWWQGATILLKVALSAIVALATRWLPLMGCITAPAIVSVISLTPTGPGRFTCCTRIKLDHYSLRPLFAISWRKVQSSIGIPHHHH